ncbi:hypothetical protein [Brachyspira hampsonii]|nr:hypothetical protein [Brachyspira hampsonii]
MSDSGYNKAYIRTVWNENGIMGVGYAINPELVNQYNYIELIIEYYYQ